jgi:hypothetical protein
VQNISIILGGKKMKGKLTKGKLVVLSIIASAIIIPLFFNMPVKTVKVEYDKYEEKVEFRGIHFAHEYILYEGDTESIKTKYKDGERVSKGAFVSNNIKSKESGILVKNLDGYENKYNLENIKDVNLKEIDNIIGRKNILQGLKILNNSEWYIYAFAEQGDFLKRGKALEIMLDGKYYSAEVIKVYINADNKYAVLKLKSDIKTINLHRGLTGYIIKSRYNGIALPKSAIIEYKGAKGVFIKYSGYVEFRKLEILYENDDVVIVNPDKSSRRKLQQHDDVILKPENLVVGSKIK